MLPLCCKVLIIYWVQDLNKEVLVNKFLHVCNYVLYIIQCAFSNGGHLFAAVTSNIIQIYSTTTFENISNLKGHNGRVKSIVWFADDSKIVSCGMDGAIYEWDPYTGKRTGDCVLKSCSYTGVATSPDGKTTFAVGSDKTLKEITLAESNVSASIWKLVKSLTWGKTDKWNFLLNKFIVNA